MKENKHYHENRHHTRESRSETRHHSENNKWHHGENRQKRNSFFRAGQIFSFIYHLTSLGLVYILVQDGESALAFKLIMFNAGLVVFALLLAAVERKLNPKPKHRGRRDNNRHRRPPHRN